MGVSLISQEIENHENDEKKTHQCKKRHVHGKNELNRSRNKPHLNWVVRKLIYAFEAKRWGPHFHEIKNIQDKSMIAGSATSQSC